MRANKKNSKNNKEDDEDSLQTLGRQKFGVPWEDKSSKAAKEIVTKKNGDAEVDKLSKLGKEKEIELGDDFLEKEEKDEVEVDNDVHILKVHQNAAAPTQEAHGLH